VSRAVNNSADADSIKQQSQSLSNILRDIDDVLPEPELTSQQKTYVAERVHNNDVLPAWELTSQQKAELHGIARECLDVLNGTIRISN
jgi:hypothetical protein